MLRSSKLGGRVRVVNRSLPDATKIMRESRDRGSHSPFSRSRENIARYSRELVIDRWTSHWHTLSLLNIICHQIRVTLIVWPSGQVYAGRRCKIVPAKKRKMTPDEADPRESTKTFRGREYATRWETHETMDEPFAIYQRSVH